MVSVAIVLVAALQAIVIYIFHQILLQLEAVHL